MPENLHKIDKLKIFENWLVKDNRWHLYILCLKRQAASLSNCHKTRQLKWATSILSIFYVFYKLDLGTNLLSSIFISNRDLFIRI